MPPSRPGNAGRSSSLCSNAALRARWSCADGDIRATAGQGAPGQQPAAGGICRRCPVLRGRRYSRNSGPGRPRAAARGGRDCAARPRPAWGLAFSYSFGVGGSLAAGRAAFAVRKGRYASPPRRLPATPLRTGLPPRFFRHWRRSAPPCRRPPEGSNKLQRIVFQTVPYFLFAPPKKFRQDFPRPFLLRTCML